MDKKTPEIWDVYDSNRQLTGRTIERAKSWGNEKYHLIVHVCIFDRDGRMLIQRRAHEKAYGPDLWDISAGGSALAGEESCRAAERETFEELGIKLDLSQIRPHFTMNYERGFDDFYLIESDVKTEDLVFRDGEVSEARWASRDEILGMLERKEFMPYFPGVIELAWQVRDNYDGAICQKK